ncbi:MAG: hypothetical protein ABSC47_04470 [Terracidiphilus sp.]
MATPIPPVWMGTPPPPVFPKPGISLTSRKFIAWGSAIVGIFILLVIIGNLLPSPPNQSDAPQPAVPQVAAPQTPQATDNENPQTLALFQCLALKATSNHYTSTNDAAVMQLISDCPDDFQRYYHACVAEAGTTPQGCNLGAALLAAKVLGDLNQAQ